MSKTKEFTEEQIIILLYLAIDLAGDGGPSAFEPEEYNAMEEYLKKPFEVFNIKVMEE